MMATMFSNSTSFAASAAGCGFILIIIAARLAGGMDCKINAAALGSGMALTKVPAIAGVMAPMAEALTSGSSAVRMFAAMGESSSNITNKTSASGPRTFDPERGTSTLGGQTPRRASDSNATAPIAAGAPRFAVATMAAAAFCGPKN